MMPGEGDEFRSLLAPNSNTGFQQQGQIDWTSLGKSSVEFTVDALSRLSSAGVDGLTIYAARALFQKVKIGRLGEQRVADALRTAQAFASHNKALWFGFGVKHIVRSLAESQQGVACIGICSCLSEEFSASMGSKILREVFELYNPPADLSPSLSQWYAVFKACQGTFASTNFGIILSELSRIFLLDSRRHLHRSSAPQEIAKVLKGLFDVSNGAIDKISISGGADCAWLAAVAHWLLGLRVTVRDTAGNVVYRPGNLLSASAKDDQVVICFGTTGTETSALTSKCYFLPSGSILLGQRGNESDILSQGRLGWPTCLCDAFGRNMELLLTSYALHTGSCLGSVARIYEYVACNPDGALLPEAILRMARDSITGFKCVGRAFILQARDRFPELQREPGLFPAMKHAQESSAENAIREFSESMNSLRILCSCGVCNMEHDSHDVKSGNEPFCMVVLIYTLCEFIRLSSGIIFQDGLAINPTLTGLDRLYSEQLLHPNREKTFDALATLAARRGRQFNDCVEQALIIFTGRSNRGSSGKFEYSAIALDGMCVYSRSLCEIPSNLYDASQVCVVPGRIEWNGIQHDQVREPADPSRTTRCLKQLDSMWYSGTTDVTEYDNLTDSSSPDLDAALIIEEDLHRSQGIEAKWCISSSKGLCYLSSRLDRYLPTDFSYKICPPQGCGSLNGFKSRLVETDGFIDCNEIVKSGQPFPSGPLIRVIAGNRLGLWLALADRQSGWFEEYSVLVVPFVQGEQCIRCCVTNAMRLISSGSNRVRVLKTCILTTIP